MRRSFLVGAGAGAVGIGIDQLLHGIFGLPLLPEQVGDGFLRLLPLKAFSALVDTLGGAARPLLLIGVTLGLLAAFGAAALSASRSRPAAAGPSLAVLGALLAVAAAASSSGSSTWPSVALEAVVLAAAVGATWFAAGRVAAPEEGIEDRRAFLRGAFGGIVALAGRRHHDQRRGPPPRRPRETQGNAHHRASNPRRKLLCGVQEPGR